MVEAVRVSALELVYNTSSAVNGTVLPWDRARDP